MASILESIASSLVETLASLATDEIKFLISVPDEIERLQSRLQRIVPYVNDADFKMLQDNDINIWVMQLKKAVYEAEDVIDDCNIEVEKRKHSRRHMPSSSSSFSSSLVSVCFSPLSCFSYYVVYRHRIGERIRGINQKLDDIIKDISVCNLRVRTPLEYTMSSITIPKTSHVEDPNIIGATIEEDANKLVKLLLANDHENKEKTLVFAITGMGGIGKTTLAQKICNDEKISAEFRNVKPIWVCVSQNHVEIDLLRLVIKQAGGDPEHSRDKEVLEPLLLSTVKEKKLFLVLDDIWDAQVWEKFLYKPLQSCLVGSRVLITTRDQAVAMSMRAAYFHQVEKLSDEDGWLLLRKMVLGENGIVAEVPKALIDIGMAIVRRCDGLPLALKTIAGVLRRKNVNRRDWNDVLQNPGWSLAAHTDDTTGALYLSYLDLPPHLKRCFLYFALFPKACELSMYSIPRYWIAEGFVKAERDKSLEDLAGEYWKELIYRSLLQVNLRIYSCLSCTMHDLVHNLARSLSASECFCGTTLQFNDSNVFSSSLSTKPRRVYIRDAGQGIKDISKDHVSLRTLIAPSIRELKGDGIAKFKCLRILNIKSSSIEKLPDSIGDLIHLRLLDISDSKIKEIPESIGNLRGLQFVLASRCENLHNLPQSIVNLTNLRQLAVDGADIQSMPPGIGRLENLVTLTGFTVSDSNLGDLSSLSKLKWVSMYKLENASSKVAARAAALQAKRHLVQLRFYWTTCTVGDADTSSYERREDQIKKAVEIIEELCPPSCLERLKIEGYIGDEYPSWIMEKSDVASVLPELTRIELINCVLCSQLPPLSMLPQLDYIKIEGASAVKSIGTELFGRKDELYEEEQASCTSYFPKLEVLAFKNMPNWEEWSWDDESYQTPHLSSSILLPCLSKLFIEGCPKLRSLPEGLLRHAATLTYLYIEGAHSLTRVQNILHLERLVLRDCRHLERVSNLPSLKKLEVIDCKQLEGVSGLDAVQYIKLWNSEIGSLPDWMFTTSSSSSRSSISTEIAERGGETEHVEELLVFPSLRLLEMYASQKLLSRCVMDGGPEWHKISLIPRVDAFHCYKKPEYYIRYTKSPFTYSTNLPKYESGACRNMRAPPSSTDSLQTNI